MNNNREDPVVPLPLSTLMEWNDRMFPHGGMDSIAALPHGLESSPKEVSEWMRRICGGFIKFNKWDPLIVVDGDHGYGIQSDKSDAVISRKWNEIIREKKEYTAIALILKNKIEQDRIVDIKVLCGKSKDEGRRGENDPCRCQVPLFILSGVVAPEWNDLCHEIVKDFICLERTFHIVNGSEAGNRDSQCESYRAAIAFPTYEIAADFGIEEDPHGEDSIRSGVGTVSDQLNRLFCLSVHPLPSTITYYDRVTLKWIPKQAEYFHDVGDKKYSLRDVILSLAYLSQYLTEKDNEIKEWYAWLTSQDVQPEFKSEPFEMYLTNGNYWKLGTDRHEIGIPSGLYDTVKRPIDDNDCNVISECRIKAGVFGGDSGKKSLSTGQLEFVEKWHNIFKEAYFNAGGKAVNAPFAKFFKDSWAYFCSLMRGAQKLKYESFSYFLFTRVFMLKGTSKLNLVYYPKWSDSCSHPNFSALIVLRDVNGRRRRLMYSLLEHTARNIDTLGLMEQKKRASVKSAIGSIMSRNGSHNIGSHVLAALSHNVGTMPDDRVLYQYIQHRMDYIATATTDRPQWRQPTMMVAGMMKEFLKQRHLLDHISGSEGLHAYKFQGQSLDANEKDAIRIHIRRVKDSEEKWEGDGFLKKCENSSLKKCSTDAVFDFIDYDKHVMVNLDEDVALAIPGGVVGNHAFYTIIENVLRNAAKHEWAEAMRVWKMACDLLGKDECRKTYKACCPRHLDVYVDFHDNPRAGKVQCRIWNDRTVSVVNTARIKTAILKRLVEKCLEDVDCGEWHEKLMVAVKTLVHLHQVLPVRNGLLDNALYKLIELELGLFQRKNESDSGDIKDNDTKLREAIVGRLCSRKSDGNYEVGEGDIFDFLRQAMSWERGEIEKKLTEKVRLSFIDDNTGGLRRENWGVAEMRISAGYLQCRETAQIGGLDGAGDPCEIIKPVFVKNDDADMCVAYRFDVDKPKLLLVVLNSKCDMLSAIRQNSMCYGVDFKCRAEIMPGKAYPYSYILFECLDDELKGRLTAREIMLPFRQLYASIDGPSDVLKEYIPEYTGTFFKDLVGNLISLGESKENAAKVCYKLLEEVYAVWLRHVQVRGMPRQDGHLPVVVLDIGDDARSGSGQTLISKHELLKFVFENSFNAAIRSFLKENGPDNGTGSLEKENRNGEIGRIPVSLPSNVAAMLYAVAQMKSRCLNEDFGESGFQGCKIQMLVDEQLSLWMREVLKDGDVVSIDLARTDQEWARYWDDKYKCGVGGNVMIEVGSLVDFDNEDSDYWLGRFEDYIASTIMDQAETFLSKYEERFVTLPMMPKLVCKDNKLEKDEFEWSLGGGCRQCLTITEDSNIRTAAITNNDICYFRHGNAVQEDVRDNYYEPLSGSQSTFNSFASLRRDLMRVQDPTVHCSVTGFLTRLVENAATRILIIDERVAKFVKEHSEVQRILGGLRIAVADDTEAGVMQMFSSEHIDDTLKFSGAELKQFEIVIIHQGIIDKLLHGHEDKAIVMEWLDRLVKKLHYVVITTGRGSPANIPDTARVLPYSVIENSILQRFPEKILLVDAIMNILPVREREDGAYGQR